MLRVPWNCLRSRATFRGPCSVVWLHGGGQFHSVPPGPATRAGASFTDVQHARGESSDVPASGHIWRVDVLAKLVRARRDLPTRAAQGASVRPQVACVKQAVLAPARRAVGVPGAAVAVRWRRGCRASAHVTGGTASLGPTGSRASRAAPFRGSSSCSTCAWAGLWRPWCARAMVTPRLRCCAGGCPGTRSRSCPMERSLPGCGLRPCVCARAARVDFTS